MQTLNNFLVKLWGKTTLGETTTGYRWQQVLLEEAKDLIVIKDRRVEDTYGNAPLDMHRRKLPYTYKEKK